MANNRAGVVVVVGLEALAAACISLIAFFMSGMWVDDGIAFQMTDADWKMVGCVRFGEWLGVSLAFGVFVAGVNWLQGRLTGLQLSRRLPFLLPLPIVLASGLGALQFIHERPFF
jgi:hypothetical protein